MTALMGFADPPLNEGIRYVPLTKRLVTALRAAKHLRGPRVLCDTRANR
jgi:hypothetical protein